MGLAFSNFVALIFSATVTARSSSVARKPLCGHDAVGNRPTEVGRRFVQRAPEGGDTAAWGRAWP
eukprot:1559278-Amphidinium_carterae.1